MDPCFLRLFLEPKGIHLVFLMLTVNWFSLHHIVILFSAVCSTGTIGRAISVNNSVIRIEFIFSFT